MEIEKFINENKSKLKTLAMFMFVFVLGFSCGYYYIDSGNSPNVLTIRDGSEECSKLFKENSMQVSQAQDSESLQEVQSSNGTVLGVDNTVNVAKAANPEAAIKAFASSKNSTLYHTKDCSYVKQIKPENLVWYSSEKEAQAAGKKPHSCVQSK